MEKNILSNLVITSIVGSMKTQTKPKATAELCNRQSWGVAIKISGKTTYTCGGKEFVSDPQNVILFPKGCSYEWHSEGGECLIINFQAELKQDTILSFPMQGNSKLVDLFQQIEKLRILKPPYYKMKSIQILYKLLILLFDSQKKYYPSQKFDLIKPAIDYIVENYDDSSINAEMLGDMTGISYTYFRKLFTGLYGYPPMEYVNRLRLKKAKEMLDGDYSSIEEVAKAVGYNSIYHFSKMFKKYYSVPPSKYV